MPIVYDLSFGVVLNNKEEEEVLSFESDAFRPCEQYQAIKYSKILMAQKSIC